MIDATTSAITTGIIVTAGRWTQGKGLEASVVIGAGMYAIILSAMASGEPQLAGQFALLVLVGAIFIYLPSIVSKVGWTPTTPITKSTTPTRPL